MNRIKAYYQLGKPGIVYGNALTAATGFFVASRGHVDWRLFAATIIGLSLVVAAACVFNNVIDRDIDSKMTRTKTRALVAGSISERSALVYANAIGAIGFIVLARTTAPALFAALAGFMIYVFCYSLWSKRASPVSTLIGSLSGAMPPVVGYAAVHPHLDAGAIILFLILVLWQMPHFYAIALYRLEDYRAAGIPVLPVVRGQAAAKIHIAAYTAAFVFAAGLLAVFDYAGASYAIIMLFLSGLWFALAMWGFARADTRVWAREMFFFSLIIIVAWCLMASIGG